MGRVDGVLARKHEAEALALRLQDPDNPMPYSEIAERMGLAGKQSAWEAANRPLKRSIAENAPQLQALMISRYEALLEAVWEDAMAGDIKAHDRATVVIGKIVDTAGLKHSDALASRAMALEEQKAMILVTIIRTAMDSMGLTAEQQEIGQRVVQEQLQLAASKDDKDE